MAGCADPLLHEDTSATKKLDNQAADFADSYNASISLTVAKPNQTAPGKVAGIVHDQPVIATSNEAEAVRLWTEAQNKYQKREFNAVLANLEALNKLGLDKVEYYGLKGGSQVGLGKYDDALTAYSVVVQKAPSAMAYTDRAFAWNCAGKYEKGRADCLKAIELDPSYGRAYQNLAWCDNATKKYKNALENINRALSLNHKDASVYNNRGWANKGLQQYDQAITDFSKAIALSPDYAIAHHGRALCYDKLGKSKEASEDRAVMKRLGYVEPSQEP